VNLKRTYHIVVDKRKLGGERKAVSVNRLHEYIPANRAEIIIKNMQKLMAFPKRYSVQNKAYVDVYLK
jgi:hypothetical protein